MGRKLPPNKSKYDRLLPHPIENEAKTKSDVQKIDRIESSFSIPGMMLKELEPQLLALSDDEKAQVIQLLSQNKPSLGRGIEKTPNVCGGSACIAGTRITVLGLVEARRIGYSEADLLTSYPSLSATDLANAWAYTEAFPTEIETEIQENDAIMHEAS
ncbi:MAG: DUF433 domain-containing protein [Thermosynechococcaceae cyanobacterium]